MKFTPRVLGYSGRMSLKYKNGQVKAQTGQSESCGLEVEHSAHDRKVVGSIPVQSNARWKRYQRL